MPERALRWALRTFPSARQLEERIVRGAAAVMNHRSFTQALTRFCGRVANAYSQHIRLIRAIGDMGLLHTVAAILAKQGQRDATLAGVQRIVCHRIASRRRVRAIVGDLERLRAIRRTAMTGDARCRQLVIGGWLRGALAPWGQAYASSARPWLSAPRPLTPAVAGDWAMKFLAQWATAYEQSGFLLTDGFPVVSMFTNHLAGHPMLLQIAGSAVLLPDGTALASFSRKAASALFGLSRTHFAAILARAERRGWMRREGRGTGVLLAEPVYHELRSWVAREIAWIAELMGNGIRMERAPKPNSGRRRVV